MTTRIDLLLLCTFSDFGQHNNDPASLNAELLKTERIELDKIYWIESHGYNINYQLVDDTGSTGRPSAIPEHHKIYKIYKFYIDVNDVDALEYKLRFDD